MARSFEHDERNSQGPSFYSSQESSGASKDDPWYIEGQSDVDFNTSFPGSYVPNGPEMDINSLQTPLLPSLPGQQIYPMPDLSQPYGYWPSGLASTLPGQLMPASTTDSFPTCRTLAMPPAHYTPFYLGSADLDMIGAGFAMPAAYAAAFPAQPMDATAFAGPPPFAAAPAMPSAYAATFPALSMDAATIAGPPTYAPASTGQIVPTVALAGQPSPASTTAGSSNSAAASTRAPDAATANAGSPTDSTASVRSSTPATSSPASSILGDKPSRKRPGPGRPKYTRNGEGKTTEKTKRKKDRRLREEKKMQVGSLRSIFCERLLCADDS